MPPGLAPLAALRRLSVQAAEGCGPGVTHPPLRGGAPAYPRSPLRPSASAVRVQARRGEEGRRGRDAESDTDTESTSSVASSVDSAASERRGTPLRARRPSSLAIAVPPITSLGSSVAGSSVGPRTPSVAMPSISGWDTYLSRLAAGDATLHHAVTELDIDDDEDLEVPESPPLHRRICGTAINLRRHRRLVLPSSSATTPAPATATEAPEDDAFPFQPSFQFSVSGPLMAWDPISRHTHSSDH
eukprot:EG_transcript_10662